ncbi:glycosyltransferase [Nocardioides sp. SYSU D00038]|uniref:glycosyltransferase n=1 Tax=Nocardioides sp. SYSU D00038 TaxID=2812554 RepID=UPI001966E74E|nr:glycosyltransferase [Nocardioides sp. SYSU D00038]
MRIALVTETFYPAVDGTTTTVRAVADHLIDAGHQVLVVAPGPGIASYRGSRVARVAPHTRPGPQVRAALASFGPDLVHVTSPGTVGRKALKHAAGLGARTLVVQHSPVATSRVDQWLHQAVARADRVVVTAEWLADDVARLGVAADTWLPGVDTRAFAPTLRDPWLHRSWSRSGRTSEPLVVVGYVGSLHRRHGVRRLAELAGVPGTRVVVVGDGPQREWLRSRLPRARFVGSLEAGHLATAMASLDVLVHPGERETCCHALREGAASGVPVVAPRSGGARAVVRPLETGLLFEPGTDGALADAVAALAADRQRGLMGAHARQVALRRTWSDAVAELVSEHYAVALGRELTAA